MVEITTGSRADYYDERNFSSDYQSLLDSANQIKQSIEAANQALEKANADKLAAEKAQSEAAQYKELVNDIREKQAAVKEATNASTYWEKNRELMFSLARYQLISEGATNVEKVGSFINKNADMPESQYPDSGFISHYQEVRYTDKDGNQKTAYFDYIAYDANGKVVDKKVGDRVAFDEKSAYGYHIEVVEKTPIGVGAKGYQIFDSKGTTFVSENTFDKVAEEVASKISQQKDGIKDLVKDANTAKNNLNNIVNNVVAKAQEAKNSCEEAVKSAAEAVEKAGDAITKATEAHEAKKAEGTKALEQKNQLDQVAEAAVKTLQQARQVKEDVEAVRDQIVDAVKSIKTMLAEGGIGSAQRDELNSQLDEAKKAAEEADSIIENLDQKIADAEKAVEDAMNRTKSRGGNVTPTPGPAAGVTDIPDQPVPLDGGDGDSGYAGEHPFDENAQSADDQGGGTSDSASSGNADGTSNSGEGFSAAKGGSNGGKGSSGSPANSVSGVVSLQEGMLAVADLDGDGELTDIPENELPLADASLIGAGASADDQQADSETAGFGLGALLAAIAAALTATRKKWMALFKK